MMKSGFPRSRKIVAFATVATALLLLVPPCARMSAGLPQVGADKRPTPKRRVVAVPRSIPRSTVIASGEVRPFRFVSVVGEVSGRIEEIYVKEGQLVAKGQPLARLDASQLPSGAPAATPQKSQSLPTAEAALKEEQQRFATAQTTFDLSQIEFRTSQRELNRASTLVEQGVLSRADYDAAKERFERARAALRTAQATLETRRVNVESAKARVNEQAGALQGKPSLRDMAIQISPLSGIIADMPMRVGDYFTSSVPDRPLITIADMSRIYVVLKVDEMGISKVEVGQRARVTIDAFSSTEVLGAVTRKNSLPIATEDPQLVPSSAVRAQTAKGFEVTIELRRMSNEIRKSLRPGMSATARITIVGRAR